MRGTRSTRSLQRNPVPPMNGRLLFCNLNQRNTNPIGRRPQNKRRTPAQTPRISANVQLPIGSEPHSKRFTRKPLIIDKPLPPLIRQRKMNGINLIPPPRRLRAHRPRIPRPQPIPKKRKLIPKPPPIIGVQMPSKIPPLTLKRKMRRMIPRKLKPPRQASIEKPKRSTNRQTLPRTGQLHNPATPPNLVVNTTPPTNLARRCGVHFVAGHYEGERSQDGESEPECSDSSRRKREPSGPATKCTPHRCPNRKSDHSVRTTSAVRIRAATPAGYTPAKTAATTTSATVSPKNTQGTCNSMSHPNA